MNIKRLSIRRPALKHTMLYAVLFTSLFFSSHDLCKHVDLKYCVIDTLTDIRRSSGVKTGARAARYLLTSPPACLPVVLYVTVAKHEAAY